MDENCRTVWYWNGYRSNSWKRDTAKILLSVLALLLVFSLPYFGGVWYFYVYPASAKKSSLYHLYLLPSVGLGCRVFFPFNMSSILSSMLFICDFSGNFSLSSLPETGLCRLHRFHVFPPALSVFPVGLLLVVQIGFLVSRGWRKKVSASSLYLNWIF